MPDRNLILDERWMAEWLDFGLRELEQYLGKHRRFDDYCAGRERQAQTPPSA